MKKIFLYACLLATMGSAVSCISDDNNYDYTDVNQIKGGNWNFQDIEDKYNLAVGQEITIFPKFEFTIDKENPDVSFEWTMDGLKIEGATQQSHTFCFDKSGTHEVSFYVIDNKSGLKYGASTIIKVMAAYQRGWLVMTKADDGRAVINFITPSTMQYKATYEGEEFTRDSVIYKSCEQDVNKNLGKNPTGMILNIGNADYNGYYGMEVYDEVVVKCDNWEELNGNTLEHEVYSLEEFGGDEPAGIKLAEGAYTYSMKAVRAEDGYIYCNPKPNAADFHVGNYISIPINNGMKFKRLFQNYKYGGNYGNTIFALTEDNTLKVIVDMGTPLYSDPSISDNNRRLSGNVCDVVVKGHYDIDMENMADNIVELRPAYCAPDNGNDYTTAKPRYVALVQDHLTKAYTLMSFKVQASAYNFSKEYIFLEDWQNRPFGTIDNYKDMAVFSNHNFVIIADGNKLYYCQYGTEPKTTHELLGERKLIKTFDHDIVSLDANDLQVNKYKQKYDYPGQLGVALDNGEFFIFSIVEHEDATRDCESVTVKQEFPNEFVQNNKFGNIIDVLYKGGRAKGYFNYEF